jgi:hypothetical protein
MKKILILQPFTDQAQAIAKFLKKYSDNFFIIGGLPPNYSLTALPHFDNLETIPLDYGINFKEYDIILPTGSESTNTFIGINESLCVGNICFLKDNLRVCDKLSMLKFINELNIPIPTTYTGIKEINTFPVFYKQQVESGRGARGIVYNKKELEIIAQDASVFFQEFIDSSATYGVAFLARDGALITSFIQKELYSYPKPGGSGVILQTFNDKKLIEYTGIYRIQILSKKKRLRFYGGQRKTLGFD